MPYSRLLKPKWLVFIPLLALLTVVAVACGEEDTPTAPAPTSTSAAPEPPAPAPEPTAMMEATSPAPEPTAMMEATSPAPEPTAMMEATSPAPEPTAMGPAPTQAPLATATLAPEPTAVGLVPQYGGIMPYSAQVGQPSTWDPHAASILEDIQGGATMYNQLLEYNPVNSTEIIPDLAKSWEVSEDGLTYTFRLNEGVMWTDGTEVTSDDVVFSLLRMIEPGKRPHVSRLRVYIDTVEKIDKYTVEVKLLFPSAAFIQFVPAVWFKILPKHHVETGLDMEKFESNTVGSGPFYPVSWTIGSVYEFEKNRNYFKEGRPYYDGFRGHIITDKGTEIAAFKTERVLANISTVNQLSPEDILRLEEDRDFMDRFGIYSGGGTASLHVIVNVNAEPFDDERIRRAMFLAMDRHAITDGFGLGFWSVGAPLEQLSPWALPMEELLTFPGYRQLDGMKHPDDIAEAQSLMRAAGYDENNMLSALYTAPIIFEWPDIAVVVKEQMREIYIDLEVRNQELSSTINSLVNGDFQVSMMGGAPTILDADDRFSGAYMEGTRNFARWTDPEVTALFNQQTRELDPQKRLELVHEMQRAVLRKAPGYMEYSERGWGTIVSKRVKTAIGHFHKCDTVYKCFKHEHEWLAPASE